MVKTVFLDYDDTLHDSQYVFGNKLDGLLKIPGEDLWYIYLNNIHRGIIHREYPDNHNDLILHCKLLLEYLHIPFDNKFVKKFLKVYSEARVETWTNPRFFKDTECFLRALKDMNLKICLTTGDFSKEKVECVNRTFKKEFFVHAFDETKLGFRKHDTKYYVKALIESGSSSLETVCIGDALKLDIEPSKAVGIKTIWLNRREEKPREVQPDFIAKDLNDTLNQIISL